MIDDIYNHFKNFGEIDKAYIIKKHNSEVSRCFGFVEFRCKEALNKVFLQKKHKINGKAIECKPLNENSKYDKQLSANISTNNEKNDIEVRLFFLKIRKKGIVIAQVFLAIKSTAQLQRGILKI